MQPIATYRFQFNRDFPFESAARQARYLADLGISHVYASPILTARVGSNHGYDVVDFSRINPDLGGETAFRIMAAEFRAQGIGIILDIVPNHMAVGGADNALWLDVLRRGRTSPYAAWFDIDFDVSDPALAGKVLCPFLCAPYEEVLAAGDLRLIREPDPVGLAIAYHHHRFPIRPEDVAAVGTDLAAFKTPARLHALLERQNFRLAWWRVAGDCINYRRFFEITELAGIEIEVDDAFEASHAIAFQLYADGLIDGVRVDHVDGLADPAAYCRKLRRRLAALAPARPAGSALAPAYVIVEKILGDTEDLPPDWLTDGTTGYDFMDEVSAFQHQAEGEGALTDLWVELGARAAEFEQEECASRRELLRNAFNGQRETVVDAIRTLAGEAGIDRDMPRAAIRRALTDLIEQLRVYRTYATGRAGSPAPGEPFETALVHALRRPAPETRALAFIGAILRGETGTTARRVHAVRRFNQLTAPVAAKAVEDTAFYRYGRLLSRNDVGFNPGRFALSADQFRQRLSHRARHLPRAMLTTATHDHKRGEDLRARLALISEMPQVWATTVRQWIALTASFRPASLTPGDAYQLLQMLYGAWPMTLAPDDAAGLEQFAGRLGGWLRKALREAKVCSSWTSPDEAGEAAALSFLSRLLDPEQSPAVLNAVSAFVQATAAAGALNALAQVTLKYTAPGMPDLYQGTETWDFSLVDPDNRRPVDYAALARSLAAPATLGSRFSRWPDGEIKQAVIARLLGLRRRVPRLFADGDFQPIRATGGRQDNVFAFTRTIPGCTLLVVVPRHTADALSGASLPLPSRAWWANTTLTFEADGHWQGLFDEGVVRFDHDRLVGDLLGSFPLGVWTLSSDPGTARSIGPVR